MLKTGREIQAIGKMLELVPEQFAFGTREKTLDFSRETLDFSAAILITTLDEITGESRVTLYHPHKHDQS